MPDLRPPLPLHPPAPLQDFWACFPTYRYNTGIPPYSNHIVSRDKPVKILWSSFGVRHVGGMFRCGRWYDHHPGPPMPDEPVSLVGSDRPLRPFLLPVVPILSLKVPRLAGADKHTVEWFWINSHLWRTMCLLFLLCATRLVNKQQTCAA